MQEIWDSHFHLASDGDLDFVDINGILCTLSANECLSVIDVDRRFTTNVYLFLGAHPWYVEELDVGKVKEMLRKYRDRIFGLGEIGLDKRRGPDMKVQLNILEQLFSIASQLDLSVNLHCVRAFSDMLSLIRDFSVPWIIIHSFSGSLFYLEKFLAQENCFISLSPFLLKKVDKLRELLYLIPLNRLLIETDYPYQCKDIRVWLDLMKFIATIKNCSESDLLIQVRRNLLVAVGEYGASESNQSFTKWS